MATTEKDKEMSDPQNAQSGKPVYVDEKAESPPGNIGTDLTNGDAPAYASTNPRYWEYR